MLTVLLTCLLTAGASFVPPADWTITKIEAKSPWSASTWLGTPADSSTICHNEYGNVVKCSAITPGGDLTYTVTGYKTIISLTRQIKPGEKVEVPEGCKMAVEVGKE